MLKHLHMEHVDGTPAPRDIDFDKGLNVFLAERDQASGKKGSRNGVGKSTLVEIIDFCLGGATGRFRSLPCKRLPGWTFVLDFDIKGHPFSVRRTADEPERIFVKADLTGCPVVSAMPEDFETHEQEFDIGGWRLILGWYYFSLDPYPDKNDDLAQSGPKYTSLISHFIRKVFEDPLNATPGEFRTKTEMAVTYLLGLDVMFLKFARCIKKARANIERRRYAAVDQSTRWVPDIRLLKNVCETTRSTLDKRREDLKSFSTRAEFAAINDTLEELTKQYHKAMSRRVANRRKLAAAKKSRELKFISFDSVRTVYESAGALFSEATLKHMEAVKDFHIRLQRNYAFVLDRQIERLEKELAEDEKSIAAIDARRAQVIQAQEAKNVFEEYSRLNENLTIDANELAVKEDCLARYDETTEQLEANTREREKTINEAKEEYHKLESVWSAEESFFQDFIKALYDDVDDISLGIKIEDGEDFGISYSPHFPSDGSNGRGKIKTLEVVAKPSFVLPGPLT